jgi:hypothetical protein
MESLLHLKTTVSERIAGVKKELGGIIGYIKGFFLINRSLMGISEL